MPTTERAGAVYALAMGDDFHRLQPELQEYFSLHPDSGLRGIGNGHFRIAGCPHRLLRPAFRYLADTFDAELFFPEYALDVPFVIENRTHADASGRPALTQLRTLRFPGDDSGQEPVLMRQFLDTTVWTGSGLADFLGRGSSMQTRLSPWADAEGRLRAISDRISLRIPFEFPGKQPDRRSPAYLPLPYQGKAYAVQWWDQESARHQIQVKVLHPWFGLIFLYAGSFTYRLEPVP